MLCYVNDNPLKTDRKLVQMNRGCLWLHRNCIWKWFKHGEAEHTQKVFLVSVCFVVCVVVCFHFVFVLGGSLASPLGNIRFRKHTLLKVGLNSCNVTRKTTNTHTQSRPLRWLVTTVVFIGHGYWFPIRHYGGGLRRTRPAPPQCSGGIMVDGKLYTHSR